MALALAIMRCFGFEGLFDDFVRSKAARHLRVLEINEAGGLTQYLGRIPGHILKSYPEIDMARLPFAHDDFDLVIHSDVLEHVSDPVRSLSECCRVLRPHRFCAFTVPMIVGRLTASREGSPPSHHGSKGNDRDDFLVHTEYGADVWRQVVESGFEEVRMYSLDYPAAQALVGVKHGSRRSESPVLWQRIQQAQQPGRSAAEAIPTHVTEKKCTELQPESKLELTGDRMIPEKSDPVTFWEHIYRYRFAARFVRGKRVLDIACGEGYGTAALGKAGATQVIGVDISEEACSYAKAKYAVDARPGNAECIPLPDQTVDTVVSFETIEHVSSPRAFLEECARVLAPKGTLVLSTPVKGVYPRNNPFHVSELSVEDLVRLLTPLFSGIRLYSQHPTSKSWWSARPLTGSSPWLRLRGSYRLSEMLMSITCPHIRGDPGGQVREAAVTLILSRDAPMSCLVNPHAVRRQFPWVREEPMYVIAVARTRRRP
jgi:ubiquinone/menaquinone biosynthesis C-methylase UbiE